MAVWQIHHILKNLPKIGEVKVALVKQAIRGEFIYYLSIYMYEEELISVNREKFLFALTDKFEIECLISDNDLNPYSWFLISKGVKKPVFLDNEKLDNEEMYCIRL